MNSLVIRYRQLLWRMLCGGGSTIYTKKDKKLPDFNRKRIRHAPATTFLFLHLRRCCRHIKPDWDRRHTVENVDNPGMKTDGYQPIYLLLKPYRKVPLRYYVYRDIWHKKPWRYRGFGRIDWGKTLSRGVLYWRCTPHRFTRGLVVFLKCHGWVSRAAIEGTM